MHYFQSVFGQDNGVSERQRIYIMTAVRITRIFFKVKSDIFPEALK